MPYFREDFFWNSPKKLAKLLQVPDSIIRVVQLSIS